MQWKEILAEMETASPEGGKDLGCSICTAYAYFKDHHCQYTSCPRCQQPLLWSSPPGKSSLMPVGSTNGIAGEEHIHAYFVKQCPQCDTYSALVPTPIIYNGNHDIYYTGGTHFLPVPLPLDEAKLLQEITAYCTRMQAGQPTGGAYGLMDMIRGILEETLARFLVEQGFKSP